MEFLEQFFHFIFHIDEALFKWVEQYDKATYLILALIIFCETGLVVMPFLPGDSLLFAAGTLAGIGLLNFWLLVIVLFVAALSGDNVNYATGNFIGHRLLTMKRQIIRKEYLDRTHAFYEKHGGKTVIIARFIPIIRTFAPFVAGLGSMTYKRFLMFCVLGNSLWILSFTFAGYAFGNIPVVKENFSTVIMLIIVISVLPLIIGYLKSKFSTKKSAN